MEGATPPSQEDAHELIGQELLNLSTNLYRAPGGKIILDVGPLSGARRISDSATSIINQGDLERSAISAASLELQKKIDAKQLIVGSQEEMHNAFQAELAKQMSLLSASFIPTRTNITDQTFARIPERTLLIVSHGAEKGGLYTDNSHEFTLHNVAQILGQGSNDVTRIINAACYGGKCGPAKYSESFPNVTNVVHGDPAVPNTISLEDQASGKFFGGKSTPVQWERVGQQWQMSPESIGNLKPIPQTTP